MKQYLLQFYQDYYKEPNLEFFLNFIDDNKLREKIKNSFMKKGNFKFCTLRLLSQDDCIKLQQTRQQEGKAYLLSLTADEAMDYTELIDIENE